MKVNVNLGLSLTFVLTMTSFQCVWSRSPFHASANENEASVVGESPLIRQTRNVHIPVVQCVSISHLTGIKNRFVDWFDKNNDGHANFEEVKAFLKSLKPDITDDVIAAYIGRRDKNENGEIDLIPEYVQEIVGNDYGDNVAREWFYLHDTDGNGYVTKSELVNLGIAVGMSPAKAEETAVDFYLPLDNDRDGQLDLNEFSQLYQPPSPPSP